MKSELARDRKDWGLTVIVSRIIAGGLPGPGGGACSGLAPQFGCIRSLYSTFLMAIEAVFENTYFTFFFRFQKT